MDANKVAESLYEAMALTAEGKIRELPIPKTISAEYSGNDSEDGEYYLCDYKDTTIKVSKVEDRVIEKGEVIEVIVPDGDLGKVSYPINGLSIGVAPKDYSYTAGEANYYLYDNKWLLPENHIYKTNLTSNKMVSEEKEIETADLEDYRYLMNKSNALIISAKIKVNASAKTKGTNFGLNIQIPMISNATDTDFYYREYSLTNNNIYGSNLWNLLDYYDRFELTLDNFNFSELYINDKQPIKISIYNKSLNSEGEGIEPDETLGSDEVIIKDVTFSFGYKFTDLERNSNQLFLDVKGGNAISVDNDKVDLIATFFHEGIINHSDVDFYFYKENLKVTEEHSKYDKFGGAGWEILNDGVKPNWVAASNTYSIVKEDMDYAEQKSFKCVAVYKKVTPYYSEIVRIKNDAGSILKFELTADKLSFATTEQITFKPIVSLQGEEKEDCTVEYYINNIKTEDIKSNILKGSDTEKYGRSFTVKAEAEVVDDDRTYYVTSNNLELENIDKITKYTIEIRNGNKVFKYDADGLSPYNKDNQSSEVWSDDNNTLSFVIKDQLGEELFDSAKEDNSRGSIDSAVWTLPYSNTMFDFEHNDFKDNKNYAKDNNHTEFSYTGNVINSNMYKIANNYNAAAANNQVSVTIKNFKPNNNEIETMDLTVTSNFTFIKDGESGTNGGRYYVRITEGDDWDENKTKFNSNYSCLFIKKDNIDFNFKLKCQVIDSMGGQDVDATAQTWSVEHGQQIVYNSTDYTFCCNFENNNITKAGVIRLEANVNNEKIFAFLPIAIVKELPNDTEANSGYYSVLYDSDGKNPKYYQNENNFYFIKENSVINPLNDDGFIVETGNKITPPKQLKANYSSFSVENEDGDVTVFSIVSLKNRYGLGFLNDWDGASIDLGEEKGKILTPLIGAGSKNESNQFTGVLMGVSQEGDTEFTGLLGYSEGEKSFFIDSETGGSYFGKNNSGRISMDPNSGAALIYSGNFWKPEAINNKGFLKADDDNLKEMIENGIIDAEDGIKNQYVKKEGMIINLSKPEIYFGSGKFSVDLNGKASINSAEIAGWNVDTKGFYKDKAGMYSSGLGVQNDNSGNYAAGEAVAFVAGVKEPLNEETNLINLNTTKFIVTHDGRLKCSDMLVSNEKNGADSIYIGNTNINKNNTEAAIRHGKTSITDDSKGFYLSNQGLSLGKISNSANNSSSGVYIDKNGTMGISEGYIGKWYVNDSTITPYTSGTGVGEYGCWVIKENYLHNNHPFLGEKEINSAQIYQIMKGKYPTTQGDLNGWNNPYQGNKADLSGAYIGVDGIALGARLKGTTQLDNGLWVNNWESKFYVDRAGNMKATAGTIGGWNISPEELFCDSEAGAIHMSTVGITLGKCGNTNLQLHQDGRIVARQGTIGGWNIGQNELSAGNIHISSNGSIYCGNSSNFKWKIDSNGDAQFNNVTALNIQGKDLLTVDNIQIFGKNENDTVGNLGFVKLDGITSDGALIINSSRIGILASANDITINNKSLSDIITETAKSVAGSKTTNLSLNFKDLITLIKNNTTYTNLYREVSNMNWRTS